MAKECSLPQHVALIMDGNGRWAKKRLMPRNFGHNAGMNAMIALSEYAANRGVKYLTVYALSTENVANRPKDELDGLYNLLRKYFSQNLKKLYKNGAAVKIIGDLSVFPDDIKELLADGEKNSPQNATFTLTFALNYGGRAEISAAAEKLFKGNIPPTQENLSSALYTHGLPDPDLIIRTGGEMRLSNFLLWQAAYAELYFCDVLFPDFTVEEFEKALKEYSRRNRRFGGV